MVPADSDRISRVPPYSGYTMEITEFHIQAYHLLWTNFPERSAILWFCNSVYSVLQPQSEDWFGLFPFRSPLLRESIFLSFPPATKMFQFTGLTSLKLWIHFRILSKDSEFPHSEISGSKITYISPKHIVVCHVLHRLLMPRHPPYALINLTTIISYLMSLSNLNKGVWWMPWH